MQERRISMSEILTKKCYKCGIEKSITEFHRDKTRIGGFALLCKKCNNESNRKSYRKKRKYILESINKNYKNHKLYLIKDSDFCDYYITKSGKIFSNYSGYFKKIKTAISNSGYELVHVTINGLCLNRTVHRLVAQTFINNPNNKTEVNHINGIKTDNRVENLEWVTSSENKKHAFIIGLNKSNIIRAKTVIAENENEKLSFSPIKSVEKQGYNRIAISHSIRSGKKYKGYNWYYGT
jgi:hypothetical protein